MKKKKNFFFTMVCYLNHYYETSHYLGMPQAAHRLRKYMLNYITWLVSKMDPVKYIFEKPALIGRIARWQVLLLEFDIVYVT